MRKLTRYKHFELSNRAKRALVWAKEKIVAEPRSFNMGLWQNRVKPIELSGLDLWNKCRLEHSNELLPPCGMVACLGGWLDIYQRSRARKGSVRMSNSISVGHRAARLLGFRKHPDFSCIFENLFHAGAWPRPWCERYIQQPIDLVDLKQNARTAASFIRYILEHGIPYYRDDTD